MWNYVKKYLCYAIPAALFMVGEVSMDLLQPGLMRRIVDEGVLRLDAAGAGGLDLIFTLGLTMVGLVLFGGMCGSLNNMFAHLASQNIGNEIRKDCFRRIMCFSFPQMDRFGTGSLVTRVTNDITQIQNFVAQFIRGMIRTTMLVAGSIFCMFRLNRQFGLMLLCAFPLLAGCMAVCLYKAGPLLPRLQEQLDEINSVMQEDVAGIRVIKACVRETYETIRFGKANDALVGTQLRVLEIFAFMNPVMNALRTAAVTAQADGFISAAPEGYGTMVAEGGASLSGGQKQRISIARAVLKPAGILIFDDSTSALDLKTEADLYAALKAAKPGTTKIIVAQRIASVRQADRIVVLRDGRIDACGTHEELLASCKTYQDIYHSQIGEEEESHG